MKSKELQTKSDKDLKTLLTEKRQALRDFRFGISGSKVRNVKEGKGLKKEIAQILTTINSKKKEVEQ